MTATCLRLLSPCLFLSVAVGTFGGLHSAAADEHRILAIRIERGTDDGVGEDTGCDYVLLDHQEREVRRLPIDALPRVDERMRLMMFWGLSSTEKYSVITRCKGEKDMYLLEDMTVDQIGAL